MTETEKKKLLQYFACPVTGSDLTLVRGDMLRSAEGREYPIVRGIPRFVSSDNYVDSFSFEWNTHSSTQLDSCRDDNYAEWSFSRKTGLTQKDVEGKLVLDAGQGAGRYCEVLARWGAHVVGVDLSYAVEAASRNLEPYGNAIVAQADIGKLPFKPETFDFVVSIGVLHHTPDTRAHFKALVPLVKPGGSISIWVYPDNIDYMNRKAWIPFTYRIPDKMFYRWCQWFVPFAHRHIENDFIRWIARVFPFSNQGLGFDNDILDTFDGFSPRFHGCHGVEEVRGWFEESGLERVAPPSDWTTCMRGFRPRLAA